MVNELNNRPKYIVLRWQHTHKLYYIGRWRVNMMTFVLQCEMQRRAKHFTTENMTNRIGDSCWSIRRCTCRHRDCRRCCYLSIGCCSDRSRRAGHQIHSLPAHNDNQQLHEETRLVLHGLITHSIQSVTPYTGCLIASRDGENFLSISSGASDTEIPMHANWWDTLEYNFW